MVFGCFRCLAIPHRGPPSDSWTAAPQPLRHCATGSRSADSRHSVNSTSARARGGDVEVYDERDRSSWLSGREEGRAAEDESFSLSVGLRRLNYLPFLTRRARLSAHVVDACRRLGQCLPYSSTVISVNYWNYRFRSWLAIVASSVINTPRSHEL